MPRILLVDDEEAYRVSLRFLLEKEGFEVAVASNGLAALAEFASHKPDLVLLDLMLPRLSGVEVFRRIRATTDIPIIMVTAKDEQHHKVAGLELGADDYVTKPFASRELIARIRSVLRRAAGPDDAMDEDVPAVEAWGIRLDPERLTMTKAGVVTPLPPKEFSLLLTLMRAQGRVLTRETLMDRVWGHDYGGDTKTLDVHVKRLRSRIEVVPSEPRILVTVRGVGYTVEPEATNR